jgi:hypothetical protein
VKLEYNMLHGFTPYGTGLALPQRFSARWEDFVDEHQRSLTVELGFEVRDSRPVIVRVAVTIEGDADGPFITEQDMRIPLGHFYREAVAAIAHRVEANPEGGVRLVPTDEGEVSAGEIPARRRVRLSDDFLREVGRVYSQALDAGEHPTQAVFDKVLHDGHPAGARSTVSRWVRRARERGFLAEVQR